MKRCPGCGEDKPRDEFWKSAYTKDGLRSRCIPCAKDQAAGWRALNREKSRKAAAAWAAKNHARRLEIQRLGRERLRADEERKAAARIYHREYYRRTHSVPPERYRVDADRDVHGNVDCEPIRLAVERSGATAYDIALQAGWLNRHGVPDGKRVQRSLAVPEIRIATALAILDALNVAPVEVGL